MNRLSVLTLVAAFLFQVPLASAQDKFKAPPGVTIERDLDFLAADRKEKLDLYRPEKEKQGELLPAVVIIHGGGWGGARRRTPVEPALLAGSTAWKGDKLDKRLSGGRKMTLFLDG